MKKAPMGGSNAGHRIDNKSGALKMVQPKKQPKLKPVLTDEQRGLCKNINMPKCWAVAAVAAAATSSQEPGRPSGRQIPSSATVVVVDRDPHHLRV
ncbi:hypothetical protein DAPPUDRAFT_234352 [Daphnia pulex]|uniref:Uncharacterized protein n=1 Tax=Daphnia pulex TaxID=6669 RepID=E9FWE6_DAPPU|nr:hypothetical protein DAPPUDRAFT_234352 [Daphnia pulex]|eukprot:EFX88443.1 hypothetical protein DAPPUDRAFT_234352 [Daphnia pulex]